jgi:hypothetical protein
MKPVKPIRNLRAERPAPSLSPEELDILALLAAAREGGITASGMAVQASGVGVFLGADAILATLRMFARSGLAEMRGEGPRFFITPQGATVSANSQ